MAKAWELQILTPKRELYRVLRDGVNRAINQLAIWIADDLVRAFVYGGHGINGLISTDFYKFIISPQGLSELGIELATATKILDAYLEAFEVRVKKGQITLLFGDIAKLKLKTPHPATGTGKLRVESWLDWIVDGERVLDAGFVPRSTVEEYRPAATKFIRLRDPLGGLMLPNRRMRSIGHWSFPTKYLDYATDWLNANKPAIELAIITKFGELVEEAFR